MSPGCLAASDGFPGSCIAPELLSCRLLGFAVGGATCEGRQEEAFSQPRESPRRWRYV